MKLTERQARELEPRVRQAARRIIRYQPALAGDAEQEIWAAIISEAAEDETFLSRTPAYIVQAGAWQAQTWLGKIVQSDERAPISVDAPVCDDGMTLGDALTSSRKEHADPAEYVLPRLVVERAWQRLAGDAASGAFMAAELMGYSHTDAAAMAGVSRKAVDRAGVRVGAALLAEQ